MKNTTKLIITAIFFLFGTINVFASCTTLSKDSVNSYENIVACSPTRAEIDKLVEDYIFSKLWSPGCLEWNDIPPTNIHHPDIGFIMTATCLIDVNNYRKPFVDYIHPLDALGNYIYANHILDWISYNTDKGAIFHCNNEVASIHPVPPTCDNYEWQCHLEDCISNNDINQCTGIGTCNQKKVCNLVKTTDTTCPGTNSGSDDTHTITNTLTGSHINCSCGSADGKKYASSVTDWPTGTNFCTSGFPNPNPVPFPFLGGTTNWTCLGLDGITLTPCSASKEGTGGPFCGDGKQDSGEACDLGYLNGKGSCTFDCKIPTPPNGGYCGNGDLDNGEQCDDHNNISGDGCSSTCTTETNPPSGGYCGDGEKQGSEACDDGNYINNDSCTNNCTEPHASHPGEKSYCGDGKTNHPNDFGFDESCDDGDTNNDNLCTNNCTDPHASQPGEGNIIQNATCSLTSSGYANNGDTNNVYATISVKTMDDKNAVDLGIPSGFKDLSNNLTDRVYNSGNSSLKFTPVTTSIIVKGDGTPQKVKIATVTSKTPFVSCGNKISFDLGGKTMVLSNVGYNFKKPYIGELALLSSGSISLGTKLRYSLSAISTAFISGITDKNISLGVNNISHSGANITLQNTKLMNYAGGLSRQFETRINSSIYATKLNDTPGLQVILPIISYTLEGETVRYYLSAYDYGNDKTPITIAGDKFLGVKIIGGLQGAGKYEFTGQGKNISNLYPSDLRTQIRKRAYDYISSIKTSGKIINKVKYVNGENVTLSGSQDDYETLVVVNGNVTINGDLNTSGKNGKKLGIIVLKDNYSTSNGYNSNGKGNILVTPNVTKINAMIYADGGFMSADNVGKVYTTDSPERTNALQKQLFMNGVMFTRNTIGGAQFGGVKNGGTYILPGGTKTQSFDRAMVYDLNYIRRGNDGCTDKSNPLNGDCEDANLGEIREGFIIKYDSRIQTDPPKLFYK